MSNLAEVLGVRLRSVAIPSFRGYDYGHMVERMLERETEVGEFISKVGPMGPREIGPAMNVYEDQAERINEVVQEYIEETGRILEKFDRGMEEADRDLVDALMRII